MCLLVCVCYKTFRQYWIFWRKINEIVVLKFIIITLVIFSCGKEGFKKNDTIVVFYIYHCKITILIFMSLNFVHFLTLQLSENQCGTRCPVQKHSNILASVHELCIFLFKFSLCYGKSLKTLKYYYIFKCRIETDFQAFSDHHGLLFSGKEQFLGVMAG